MKRLSFVIAGVVALAAQARAGEEFLAIVREAGERQNLRRVVSTEPRPIPKPPPAERAVSLKLPSLGRPRDEKLRLVEVGVADDGVLDFGSSRATPFAPGPTGTSPSSPR